MSNVATATLDYGYNLALVKGILLIIFAFELPKIFMDEILQSTYFKDNKLLTGLVIIYLIDLIINLLFCKIKNYMYKDKKHD